MIKLVIRHVCFVGILLGMLVLIACSGDQDAMSYPDLPQYPAGDDNSVLLSFAPELLGGRAEAETPVDDEAVKHLRIVIVSEAANGDGWEVEENFTATSTLGTLLTGRYVFKVRSGCHKRIYLLANCEGLKAPDGSDLDFGDDAFIPATGMAAPVDGYVFGAASGAYSYDPAGAGLPMTAVYDVDVPSRLSLPDRYFYIDRPLYLVRAATKFTFTFANTSTVRTVSVTGVDICPVVDSQMYLMAHVNRDGLSGSYWVADTDRSTRVSISDWMSWLADEVAKTQNDANIDRYQWLTDYDVPGGATDAVYGYAFPTAVAVAPGGEPVAVPYTIYLPESEACKADVADASLLLQEYRLTLHTSESYIGDTYVSSNKYDAVLPQLASLFRNTHVKVYIEFNDHEPNCMVDLEPYWSVKLDPVFGLD